MLTIFSCPKPFVGESLTNQYAAIASWKLIAAPTEIVLIGDEAGVADAAQEFGIKQVSDVQRNTWGTPLVSDVLAKARFVGKGDVLMYVNADIVFCNDFEPQLGLLPLDRYLAVGGRWEIDKSAVDSFGDSLEGRIEIAKQGRLSKKGTDYLIYPREIEWDFPPLAVGRPYWDNYFIFRARQIGIDVIDVTDVVIVAHPRHGYEHVVSGASGTSLGPEGDLALRAAGGRANCYTVRDATWLLADDGIRRARRPTHLARRAVLKLFWRSPLYTILRPIAGPFARWWFSTLHHWQTRRDHNARSQ